MMLPLLLFIWMIDVSYASHSHLRQSLPPHSKVDLNNIKHAPSSKSMSMMKVPPPLHDKKYGHLFGNVEHLTTLLQEFGATKTLSTSQEIHSKISKQSELSDSINTHSQELTGYTVVDFYTTCEDEQEYLEYGYATGICLSSTSSESSLSSIIQCEAGKEFTTLRVQTYNDSTCHTFLSEEVYNYQSKCWNWMPFAIACEEESKEPWNDVANAFVSLGYEDTICSEEPIYYSLNSPICVRYSDTFSSQITCQDDIMTSDWYSDDSCQQFTFSNSMVVGADICFDLTWSDDYWQFDDDKISNSTNDDYWATDDYYYGGTYCMVDISGMKSMCSTKQNSYSQAKSTLASFGGGNVVVGIVVLILIVLSSLLCIASLSYSCLAYRKQQTVSAYSPQTVVATSIEGNIQKPTSSISTSLTRSAKTASS